MKKINSVAFRFLLFFILGIMGYSATLFITIHSKLDKGLYDYIEDTLETDENGVNITIHGIEESTEFVADWISSSLHKSIHDVGYIDANYATKICANASESFDIGQAAIYDNNGKLISNTIMNNINVNSVVQQAIQSKSNKSSLVVSNTDLYAVSAIPMVHDKEVIAVSLVYTPVSSASFVEKISEMYDIQATYFSKYKRQYTTLPGMLGTTIDNTEIIDHVMKGNKVVQQLNIANTPYLANYFPIKDQNGKIHGVFFIGKEVNAVDEISTKIFKPVAMLAPALTLLLMGLMVLIVYQVIIKKLKHLNKNMANLASGEADLTLRLPEIGKDEFRELCNNVNIFMELLQSLIKKLNGAQSSLESIGENLGTNSQESASATTEIMANIDSVRRQAKAQSDAVEETAIVIDKSSEGVEELVTQINNQVAGITESSAAIEQMLGNISSVSNSVKKMSDSFEILDTNVNDSNTKIEKVSNKVNEMAQQSEMLLQANNMIAQVASQTNLLAMNAAIEAAHAGEAGKGFSVVADEIRKLAETTSAQSKNINVELKDIINSIQEVVALSKDAMVAFNSIVSQLTSTDTIMGQIDNAMTEQSLASNQILEALSDMKNQSTIVNDKSLELKMGVSDVNKNMQTVSQVSSTILGSMDEMAAGSQQISASSQDVSELAMQTKENIELMDSLLKQFKI